jgi:hypothetical protein
MQMIICQFYAMVLTFGIKYSILLLHLMNALIRKCFSLPGGLRVISNPGRQCFSLTGGASNK